MSELNATTLVFGFIWYIAFLFSTTCHEASHALVAKLGGDDTADRAGQVTLNPVPHIRREPWGMVVIPLVSFLFFGPAANFALMGIAAILIRVGLGSGWLGSSPDGRPGMLDIILIAFFRLNLLLGIFNLFPVPPLDGSTGVMVFMDDSTARRYMNWLRTTPYRSLGLLVALLAFRYFYAPVEKFATNLLLYTRF